MTPSSSIKSFISGSVSVVRLGLQGFLLSFLVGCATPDFVTHYGIFEAENSAGETRLFRVYWQTVRYEGWKENRYQAFPVILESQCSQRVLRFYDQSFGDSRRCSEGPEQGIHFCASAKLDESRRGLALRDGALCGVITDRRGSKDILSLEGEILITLNCQPKVKERRTRAGKLNTDFLMGSSLPYIVSTKQVLGQDIEQILPEVSQHSSICDPDY